MSSNSFCVDSLTSDGHISFYIGLSSSEIFMAMFDHLNPGDNCENICPGGNMRDVPEDFYDSDSVEEDIVKATMKGQRSKLKPLDKFFIILCRLRRGFAEKYLGHLYGVAQSTLRRSFVQWINSMYLKFGHRRRSFKLQCLPYKFPTTRVIVDCTEVRCEMPSS